MIEIDRRIRAKEFMQLLSIGKDKFYNMINTGDIQQPIRLSDKDVFGIPRTLRIKLRSISLNLI
jgi:predicted DNA-binding transcriptional regulator AlpA